MNSERHAKRWQRQMLVQGGALFIVGLIVGLIFTFVIIGHVEIWPLVPAIDVHLPGAEAAWRRAHLGLMFNAITLLIFAGISGLLALGPRQLPIYAVSVMVTAWGNSAGFLFAALFGGRGLAVGGGFGNTLAYLCFLVAAVTAFVQAGLLIAGALNRSSTATPSP